MKIVILADGDEGDVPIELSSDNLNNDSFVELSVPLGQSFIVPLDELCAAVLAFLERRRIQNAQSLFYSQTDRLD